jgi:hypothetical protein
MPGKARTAIALLLTLGWGCGHAPTPTPASSPSPPQQPGVIIERVPSPDPVPGPVPAPAGTFKIVLATPAEHSTISLSSNFAAPVQRPILDFEFRYPVNLVLDDDFTNIEISLLIGDSGNNSECLGTDLAHAIRLDRDDKVYLANSVALFRTGAWRRAPSGGCGDSSFTTRLVSFKLTPVVSQPRELWTFLPMEWDFVGR